MKRNRKVTIRVICQISDGNANGYFFLLVFFIKCCFIPIGTKEQSVNPLWGSAHLPADGIKVGIHRCFNDQFIVYMTYDKAVRESTHCMPNITPHVCRHTYCSNMAKSGMNPKTLQYLMGHSDIAVTLNVYTHVGLEDAEKELQKMQGLENARKEMEISDMDDKPLKQNMFKVV